MIKFLFLESRYVLYLDNNWASLIFNKHVRGSQKHCVYVYMAEIENLQVLETNEI